MGRILLVDKKTAEKERDGNKKNSTTSFKLASWYYL